MKSHPFIYSPYKWLGEGIIELNMLEEPLGFCTRWVVHPWEEGKELSSRTIECVQEIQVKGLSDMMTNQFIFSSFTATAFEVYMENYAVGQVRGKGFWDTNKLGWEFRVPETGFEGFELYEKQEDGSYLLYGEFATADDLRTKIRGKLWKQLVVDQ